METELLEQTVDIEVLQAVGRRSQEEYRQDMEVEIRGRTAKTEGDRSAANKSTNKS